MPDQGLGIYNPYRFGYRGQFAEKDAETGWNHFEARENAARIGRWMTTDPKRAGFSSYWSMNNNPVYYADPDGRCPECEWIEDPFDGQTYQLENGAIYEYVVDDWVRINDPMLNEVVVTPNLFNKTIDLGSGAALDIVNSFANVGLGITMPIIQNFNTEVLNNEKLDWAKMYKFDKNWKVESRNLKLELNQEESKEILHSTLNVITTVIPGPKVVTSYSNAINWAGNSIIKSCVTTPTKMAVDRALDYHK